MNGSTDLYIFLTKRFVDNIDIKCYDHKKPRACTKLYHRPLEVHNKTRCIMYVKMYSRVIHHVFVIMRIIISI